MIFSYSSIGRAASEPPGYVSRWVPFGLALAFALAVALRWSVIGVGAPFITIDDKTAFEGGFLVWFGYAPPQRMYLESWIYGLCSMAVYAYRCVFEFAGRFDINFVAAAYRDFYAHPEPYVLAYRVLTLATDLATTWLVYRMARRVLGNAWSGWAAVAPACLYLFSYNVIWSGMVARPDSILALLCVLGLWLYLRSDGGRGRADFLASSIVLGLAAGQKLHGAFMAIFICADLWRVHGLRTGFGKVLQLAAVSTFFFLFAAGSPFFDPLMYLKLRGANYADDYSPWLHWGGHFLTMLRGAAWLALPLALLGVWFAFTRKQSSTAPIRSIAVLVLGWLLLFAAIRQLRAYWMLPALPIFYVAAVYSLTQLRARTGVAVAGLVMILALGQTGAQVGELRAAQFGELRNWVRSNVGAEPFYILGYDALILPKNTLAIQRMKQVLEQSIARDLRDGLPFTLRHVKSWEERGALQLLDMLDARHEPGFEFYDFYSAPPVLLAEVMDLSEFKFVLLQEGFDLKFAPQFGERIAHGEYVQVANLRGAGGNEAGLAYTVYRRR